MSNESFQIPQTDKTQGGQIVKRLANENTAMKRTIKKLNHRIRKLEEDKGLPI